MNNFKGGSSRSSESKFKGKKKFGGNKKHPGGHRQDKQTDGGQAEKFSATCSECQKRCDVPFRPSPDKPVYCSACFGMKKSANESRGSEAGRGRNEKDSYHSERPSYVKTDRQGGSSEQITALKHSNEGISELKRQIKGLEVKLNRILDLINPPLPSAKVPETAQNKPKKVTKTLPPVATKTPAKAVPKKVASKTLKTVTPKKTTPKTAVKKVTKKSK